MSIVVHETSRAILLLTAYKPGGKFGALQIDLSTDKVLSFSEKIQLHSFQNKKKALFEIWE